MSNVTIYWRGWGEKQLAGFQQNQGDSNHCGKYAAASALNMLYGTSIPGHSLVDWLDKRPLKGTGWYTILGNNNGSFIFQTANIIRKLGHLHGLAPEVRIQRGTIQTLKDALAQGNKLIVASVTYFQGKEPIIAYGHNTGSTLSAARWVGGHLMILAAYDPQHQNTESLATPWGFVSSWSGKDHLYWMTEDDFSNSWGKLSIFNMVTITR
jgi:hypothetical protein